MAKKVYVCLPYRGRANQETRFDTMVYAGNRPITTDGDILEVTYDEAGSPVEFRLVNEERL